MREIVCRTSMVGLLVLGLAACGGGDAPESGREEGTEATDGDRAAAGGEVSCEELVDYDEDTLRTTESGLRMEVLASGEGEVAEAGDTVVVHYLGCLTSGEKFDSSYDRGSPFGSQRPLVLGTGQVIPGWDEGLVGMQPGERRLLVIPPALAYGDRGAGSVIPPNSTLVFQVEMLRIGERGAADPNPAASPGG